MRVLGFILVMVMISTSSQSSEKRDFQTCYEIARTMNMYLGMHSDEWNLFTKMLRTDKNIDGEKSLELVDKIDVSLTKASKYATIFNAKCKE